MKSIFNKIFGTQEQPFTNEEEFLKIPPPITIESPLEAQKRALIGTIARKMSRELGEDNTIQKAMVYFVFATESFRANVENPTQYTMYLAERMVCWIQDKEDVYLRIRELNLSEKYHKSFLKVYEEIKYQIQKIFHPDRTEPDASSSEDQIWQVYRDVIYAATQRKFLLISKNEVERYRAGHLICEIAIAERSDITKARDMAKEKLIEIGFTQAQVMSYLLVISEAVTNILKHAEVGKMSLVESHEHIHVIVEDKGPGFDLKLLPNTTLMAGYSTKKSLGQGFTLMMKMAEQVMLATNSEGSTIILVFNHIGGVFIGERSHA